MKHRRFGASLAAVLMVLALAGCADRKDGVDVNPGKGNDGTGSAKCGDQRR